MHHNNLKKYLKSKLNPYFTGVIFLAILFCGVLPFSVSAANRVYYQNFNNPASVESHWFNTEGIGKRLVDSSDGAVTYDGKCLRGNWGPGVTDPITGLTSSNDANSRYANVDLDVNGLVTNEMFYDYWAYVDNDAVFASTPGIKWLWMQGGAWSSRYWNHILTVQIGWDDWRIGNNGYQGEIGYISGNPRCRTLLSQVPGITALRNGKSVDEWFRGSWHHFQVYMKLNTPASDSNGIFKFWIDNVLVMNISDYKWRDSDADNIWFMAAPSMYGGADPPLGTFGWQIDEVQVWDGMPLADITPPAAPTGLSVN
jgi:hypothetical protein